MILLGLAGVAGCGKSAVARHLRMAYGFQEFSFAEPLKRGVAEMFGLSDAQVNGSFEEKEAPDPFWGVSGRELLQVVGTEIMRVELPRHLPVLGCKGSIWVRHMERRIRDLPAAARVVISDVRFADEVLFIQRLGGEVWNIDRPGLERRAAHAHSSENLWYAGALGPDRILPNTGTLGDLCTRVDEAICAAQMKKGPPA